MTAIPAPRYCQAIAYARFVAALPDIESSEGLVRAAVAISRHCLADAQYDDVERQLDTLAGRVRHRVRSNSSQAILAHLHQVLFTEEGFCGNPNNYYDPSNSFLPAVLASRRGIPITLSLIYKAVGGRLGLTIHGLNSPGHFLVEVLVDHERMIVDPFHHGVILNPTEAHARLQAATGTSLPNSPDLFRRASHLNWIARMLHNLQGIFAMRHSLSDLQAMIELEHALNPG